MAICLLLKADIVISLDSVPVFDTEHQPLDAIPNEKRNIKQLPLLGHMDELVIDGSGTQGFTGQDELTQRQRKEIFPQGEFLDSQNLGHIVEAMASYPLDLFSFMYSRGDMP